MGLISNGTTIFDNGSMASGFGGSLNFISKQTASSSASISFTSGIDSTYKEYLFYFVNIHPATDSADFFFNLSTDSGSTYNVTKTSTFFGAYNDESGTSNTLGYFSAEDLAQSTSDQKLFNDLGNGNDETLSGSLHLFNPSSTTFVKHFISNIHGYNGGNFAINSFIAGYGNTTSSIDAVKFVMSSGNIDSGDILLYGIA
jgi:hypothetical protein